MKKLLPLLLVFLVATLAGCSVNRDQMLIVLNAPSVNSEYYEEVFEDILDFHVQYTKKIMGNDEVVVLADVDTLPYLQDRLPPEVLLEANVEDIWMRDFTTVNPLLPIQFDYVPSYFESQEDADYIQDSFNDFAEENGVSFISTDLILDGGNVVDNYVDKIVVTERFLEDNEISKKEAKEALEEFGIKAAIIPYDDEIMGHADGMVMWLEENTLVVNRYDEPFRSDVLNEIKASFPEVKIIEVEAEFEIDEWKDFASACGINVNSVTTFNNIYVPVFGSENDNKFIEAISAHTDKNIIPVEASNVCFMGGSVRCLSWQVTGEAAQKIKEAAIQL